jgi:uncharacterized protein YfbU (UPF0304 family)
MNDHETSLRELQDTVALLNEEIAECKRAKKEITKMALSAIGKLGALKESHPDVVGDTKLIVPEGYSLVKTSELQYVYDAASEVRCNAISDLVHIKSVLKESAQNESDSSD